MARTAQQETGRRCEDAALAYLESQGLTLVTRNYLCQAGELDLIMRDDAHLVFVEVRARADARYGGAAASITPAKQRRLERAAQHYLQRQHPLPPCRFDVVAFDGGAVHWLRNVIVKM